MNTLISEEGKGYVKTRKSFRPPSFFEGGIKSPAAVTVEIERRACRERSVRLAFSVLNDYCSSLTNCK